MSVANDSAESDEPEYGVPDADNFKWTAERMRRAMRFHDLPPEVQAAAKRKPDEKP